MTPSLFAAPALTAPALLESLALRGAVVSLAGAAGDRRLHVAPRDVLTDADRADIRRLKPDLIELLEAPDVAASATTGGAAVMAPGDGAPDVSAIAPDVMPRLTQGECAAMLARYRAGGAVLTLEMVTHDGARKLALGIELTARVAPEKRARAFRRIGNHGLEMVRALELEGAPITDGGAAAMLYAPDDLAVAVAATTRKENQT